MATAPLIDRITDAIQREYDLIVELRALASEFADSIERMRVMTSRLQYEYERQMPTANVVPLTTTPTPPEEEDFPIPSMFKRDNF